MLQDHDFKRLERQAYVAYHQDGLLDIAFGLSTLGVGVIFLTGGSWGFFLSWMPFALYLSLKRMITVPRLGYAEFRRQESRKGILSVLGLLLVLGIVVVGIFLLGVFSLRADARTIAGESIDQYVWMAVSGIGAVVFVGAVLALRLPRLIVYAALTAIMVIAGYLLEFNPALYLLILGAVFLITGLVLLVRFLRMYPPVRNSIDGEGHHAAS